MTAAGGDRGRAPEPGQRRLTVIQTPRMRRREGPPTPQELAHMAPADRSVHPRLAVPPGWSEVNVAGAHQTLMLNESARYRGVLTEVRVAVADAGAEPPAADEVQGARGESVALVVEPWTSGHWHGVHSAWTETVGQTAVHLRLWDLPTAQGERILITARYTAALGRHLDRLVDSLVAGLETDAPGRGPGTVEQALAVLQERMGHREAPGPSPTSREVPAAAVDWLRGQRDLFISSRLAAEPSPPPTVALEAGLAEADGAASGLGQRVLEQWRESEAVCALYRSDASGGTRLAGHLWLTGSAALVMTSRDGARAASGRPGGGRTHVLDLRHRAAAAVEVLRLAGHVPEGPSDWPSNAPAGGDRSWYLVRLAADPAQDPTVRSEPNRAAGGLHVETLDGVGHFRRMPAGAGTEPDPEADTGATEPHSLSGLTLFRWVHDWLERQAPSSYGHDGRR